MLFAGRLKNIVGKVISFSKSVFVVGRQLLDGVLVANEMVDFAIKEKRVLLFKVDFEKAYDKVNWSFLRFMLLSMRFGELWMKWMETMIFASNMSVMVNGGTIREFKVERGLRQGDPICPFLSVIVAEGLKGLINKAVENGVYAGFYFNRNCFIDVLQFADDTILIEDGNWNHVWAIKSVPRGFELISGPSVNFHKSKLIDININYNFMDRVMTFLASRREDKEFSFLGIPIGSNPRRIATWNHIKENQEEVG